MEQLVLQSQKRNKYARKRALWFVSLLLVLVISASIGLGWMMLDATRARLITDLDHQLVNQAQERTSTLTVWYGGLRSRVAQFADADLLRLFATEVNLSNVAEVLELAKKNAQEASQQSGSQSDKPEESAGAAQNNALASDLLALQPAPDGSTPAPKEVESSDLTRLADQMPLMHGLLANFVRSGFAEASLVTASGEAYLTACNVASSTQQAPGLASASDSAHNHPFTPEMQAAARKSLASNEPGVFPLYEAPNGQLQFLVTQLLYAPVYMANPDNKPVGVLLLTYDATSVVRGMSSLRDRDRGGEGGRLLVDANGTLLEARTNAMPRLISMPGWTPVASNLPLELRPLPGGGAVWSRGLKVPDLPWYVVRDIDTGSFASQLDSRSSVIVLAVTAAGMIALLLIGMIWWWLIGRQERAVSNELKDLYQTVNRQHEFLRGINGTLGEGICLFDGEGTLQYANDAFAAMFKRTPDELIGQDRTTVFGRELMERLLPHALRVLEHNAPDLFTEVLVLPIGRRNCQVSCSPFRNEHGVAVGVVSTYRDITELVQAHERAQAMVHQTINVLVRAIEAVDPYLRGQSMHTGLLAAELARGLGLAPMHAATVRAAANLSHIGMIQLPHDLITKAAALTPEERVQMERHVEYARASLEGIDFGLPVVEAITQMHERLDGSGYPLGLQGVQINTDARLLAVANTFCALMRPRSYRTARSVKDALMLLNNDPPRYDPDIVQALYNFLASPAGAAFMTVLCQTEQDTAGQS